ncbi:MAG: hypothetical protein IT258_17675 [Saprospiraceae bacterium]|nr:hypothetical protein [Saprospiraceae bacterium]
MTTQPSLPLPLNDVQLMLLKLFSRPVSPTDMDAIRNFLLDYYEKMLQNEVAQAIETKGITRADFDNILNEQQRTK